MYCRGKGRLVPWFLQQRPSLAWIKGYLFNLSHQVCLRAAKALCRDLCSFPQIPVKGPSNSPWHLFDTQFSQSALFSGSCESKSKMTEIRSPSLQRLSACAISDEKLLQNCNIHSEIVSKFWNYCLSACKWHCHSREKAWRIWGGIRKRSKISLV